MARIGVLGGTFAATWLIAAAAWAQSAQIQGKLVDEQGGALPGAQVSAIDEEKGVIARQATSGADGFFNLVTLLRGRYTVRAELSGFKTHERRGLVLDPGQVLDLSEVKLAVGALTETVDVVAESPVVEIGTSQKSYTISDTQVRELSLNGRDFTSLLKTLPGVATNDTGFRLAFNSTEGFMVNGLRQSMNNVMLDGTPNTDTGANDGQYTQLSLDAVGEFKGGSNHGKLDQTSAKRFDRFDHLGCDCRARCRPVQRAAGARRGRRDDGDAPRLGHRVFGRSLGPLGQ